MVCMMAQTHYLMAAPLPSLVFKKAEFIAVMFKLELRIASVASREVIEEDVRYSNIAKLSWTIQQLFFLIKSCCWYWLNLQKIPLTTLMCIPLLSVIWCIQVIDKIGICDPCILTTEQHTWRRHSANNANVCYLVLDIGKPTLSLCKCMWWMKILLCRGNAISDQLLFLGWIH